MNTIFPPKSPKLIFFFEHFARFSFACGHVSSYSPHTLKHFCHSVYCAMKSFICIKTVIVSIVISLWHETSLQALTDWLSIHSYTFLSLHGYGPSRVFFHLYFVALSLLSTSRNFLFVFTGLKVDFLQSIAVESMKLLQNYFKEHFPGSYLYGRLIEFILCLFWPC